jgi:DNA invertase Pin-like site-specific DNA recombinase
MVYGYIRVSTDRQTVENQRFEISRFAQQQNLQIDGWIEETISGAKNYTKRGLGRLLKKVRKGDLIICAELSRLGRSLFMIMEILNICMNKECRVWTIKDGYRLGDDIQSKVLAFAFGLSAEIERNLISQRTKEALARKKAEGVILGRPKGKSPIPNQKCEKNREWIREMISRGMPKSNIAKNLHIARGTLYRFLSNAATTSTSAGNQLTECNSVVFNHLAASCSNRVNSPPITKQ